MMTRLDRPLIRVGSIRIPGKQHDRQERKPEDIIQEWLTRAPYRLAHLRVLAMR
jgi:hypothetical protein